MDKLADIKVVFTARDKETNHLRIESHALPLEEVADYIRKHVVPTADEYTWTMDYRCPEPWQKPIIEVLTEKLLGWKRC